MKVALRTLTRLMASPQVCLIVAILCGASCSTLVDPSTTLGCHVRLYQFHAVKPDIITANGDILTCQGDVTVNSCWGRCDSSEIGDFKMPFKISHHPVCTYTGQRERTVVLSDCEGYPDPTLQVFDATGCALPGM
ncbi:hypothetical protein C0Q70_13463 [Pomacea canaliculata]|uniref:Glycoprotein hormone subunit beta domain-containing protein n=1 Tax=Pomacea canaliculata TaxID=400727 RepID=A0A2T7NXA8_POMCA|nr:hypothetical protein C0Q70_13463 [Pomacea canaliculata]